jgi:hypothetical protein
MDGMFSDIESKDIIFLNIRKRVNVMIHCPVIPSYTILMIFDIEYGM